MQVVLMQNGRETSTPQVGGQRSEEATCALVNRGAAGMHAAAAIVAVVVAVV